MNKSKNTTSKKETIYVDADDDITVVIEHVKNSSNRIIALVIPKRSETLKSVVNMKLLKRSGVAANKRVVLITKDETVIKISAAVGVYVASSLSSKPEIPEKQIVVAKKPSKEEPDKTPSKSTDDEGTNESKQPYDKKLKVPSFGAFRKRIMIVSILVIALPVAWYVMFRVLPSATVVINTNARSIEVALEANLDSQATTVDHASSLLPAELKISKKQITQKVIATGQKQIGSIATGLMTVSNCSDAAATVATGTAFTSGGLKYVSRVDIALDSGNFTGAGTCKSTGGHVKTITVFAELAGDQYNLSARSYVVSGQPSKVTAFGADMSGGSSNLVPVISQNDIDLAIQNLEKQIDDKSVSAELKTILSGEGYLVLNDTFAASHSDPTSSVVLDQQTAEGVMTMDLSYQMHGIKQADVLSLALPRLEEAAGNLRLIESGIDKATYKAKKRGEGYVVDIVLKGSAGVILTEAEVFEQIKNRVAAEAASDLRKQEGVTSVEVKTSPFWIKNIPTSSEKVTIKINGDK